MGSGKSKKMGLKNRERSSLPHRRSSLPQGRGSLLLCVLVASWSSLPHGQSSLAQASELSYTFLDFQRLDNTVEVAGVQSPVPLQTVSVNTRGGDGIAVGGSMAAGDRFYLSGVYRSSIIDFSGIVTSPLATLNVADEFDLTLGRLSLGYLRPIGEELDFIAEISYDSVNWDFGSLAGENFDLDDTGVGAQVGLRWNPVRSVELFAFARQSPVAKPNLSTRTLESDTTAHVGVRVYLFRDLGIGLEHESGEVETTTISMRFSFGNLPW